ncbi:hypothetical protein HY484_01500 [Candidatus Woesearchaeota archaeon]|nr:hypothetical protein [Candidatus Woesearchaeota archaeon]
MIFQFTGTTIPLIATLQQYGFVDLVIPFVLIFAVLFGILSKVKLFGDTDEAKKYNAVIAIAITLLIVMPHALSPSPNDAVSVINRFLPEFVFISIAMLILLMLVGLVGGTTDATSGGGITAIAALLAVIYLTLVIINALSPTSLPYQFLNDPNFQALVIVILGLGLIIWYIVRKEGEETKFWDTLQRLFGGGGTT